MNVYLPFTARLPSEYQEVEYIQSSGTQHIIIGTSFKSSYKVAIDFQMTATGGDQVPVGLQESNVGRFGLNAYGSYFKVISGGSGWSNTIAEDTNRHTITIDKSTATVDGTNYSSIYTSATYSNGIGVFVYNHSQGLQCYSSNKLYKLDIYDENGTHIYDLVPCYRKADNVIGLYDLVNSVFYTNQGTGTFIKGNDVTMAELKNAYIGEYKGWTPGSNTIAYYKFDGNLNDSSGNNRNMAMEKGSFTYGTLSQGAKYVQTNFNSYSSQISSFPLNSNSATISFWMSFVNGTAGNGNTSSTYGATVFDLPGNNGFVRPVLSWGYNDGYLTYGFCYLDVTNHYVPSVSESWHLYTAVLNGGTSKIYIDGVLRKTGTYPVNNGYSFRLNTVDGNSTQRRDYSSRDKLSELIFENKQWTQQEIQDYYNLTKSKYGL